MEDYNPVYLYLSASSKKWMLLGDQGQNFGYLKPDRLLLFQNKNGLEKNRINGTKLILLSHCAKGCSYHDFVKSLKSSVCIEKRNIHNRMLAKKNPRDKTTKKRTLKKGFPLESLLWGVY